MYACARNETQYSSSGYGDSDRGRRDARARGDYLNSELILPNTPPAFLSAPSDALADSSVAEEAGEAESVAEAVPLPNEAANDDFGPVEVQLLPVESDDAEEEEDEEEEEEEEGEAEVAVEPLPPVVLLPLPLEEDTSGFGVVQLTVSPVSRAYCSSSSLARLLSREGCGTCTLKCTY